MGKHSWFVTGGLLTLTVGCQGLWQEAEPEGERPQAVRDDGPSEDVKRRVRQTQRQSGLVNLKPAELAGEVRARLPQLKPGMAEAEVMAVLAGLPLGEEEVVSRTISGGKTVRYALSAREQLELTFIPLNLSESPPGGLREARLLD